MFSISMIFIIVPILAFVLLGLNILLANSKPNRAKVKPYECGFEPISDQTRNPFQIQFYLVGVLFLVFDLELVLAFPLAVSLPQLGIYGLTILIIFFIILTVGFVFEIASGAVSLQNITLLARTNKDINNSPDLQLI